MTRQSKFAVAASAGLALGCGSGGGLMHPAHTLQSGVVTMGAGMSSQFVVGEGDDKIQAARAVAPPSTVAPDSPEEKTYIEGAMAEVLSGPGLAPWVGARTGVGYTTDVGITYTGRRARLDGRHAFEEKATAVSIGLGATAVLAHPSQSSGDAPNLEQTVPGFDAGPTRGFGVDVPIIVGWRSSPALVQLWGGGRFGVDRMVGHVIIQGTDPASTFVEEDEFEANRWFAGLVAGLGVGIEPVMIALELNVGFVGGKGSVRRTEEDPLNPGEPRVTGRVNGEVETLFITPTAAAIFQF
jgi:hypothetical protein